MHGFDGAGVAPLGADRELRPWEGLSHGDGIDGLERPGQPPASPREPKTTLAECANAAGASHRLGHGGHFAGVTPNGSRCCICSKLSQESSGELNARLLSP